MFRKFRLTAVLVPLITLVSVLTLECHSAEAQDKPFKVKGEGNAPNGLSVVDEISQYTMSGTATHLGKYSGFGIAQVIGDGVFTGGYVFVAANGDRLVCEHPGTFELYPDGQDGLFAVLTPSSLRPASRSMAQRTTARESSRT